MTKMEVFKTIEKDICTSEYLFKTVHEDLEIVDVEITKNFSIKIDHSYGDLNYYNHRSSRPDSYSYSFKKGEKCTAILRKSAKVLVGIICTNSNNMEYCVYPRSRKVDILIKAFETWIANTKEISKNPMQDDLDKIIEALKNGRNPFEENKKDKIDEALNNLVEFLNKSNLVECVKEDEKYEYGLEKRVPTKNYTIKAPFKDSSMFDRLITISFNEGKPYSFSNHVIFNYTVCEELLKFLKEYGDEFVELKKLTDLAKAAQRM